MPFSPFHFVLTWQILKYNLQASKFSINCEELKLLKIARGCRQCLWPSLEETQTSAIMLTWRKEQKDEEKPQALVNVT